VRNRILAFILCMLVISAVVHAEENGVSAASGEQKKEALAQEAQSAAPTETRAPSTEEVPSPSTEAPQEAAPEAVTIDPGNVTVNFKGADIRTVLSYIAEVSGVDIVPAPDVKGPIDIKLTNKPWRTALDVVVRNYGFAYEERGGIIRVASADKLKQEDLTTQAFTLNYSKAKDVLSTVKGVVGSRGSAVFDERTNTMLVTDVPSNVSRIGGIIATLDKRTGQVVIEARIIETVLGKDEKLGIDWNTKFTVAGAKRPMTFPFESFKTPFNVKKAEMEGMFPQVNAVPSTAIATSGTTGTTTTTTNASDFPSTYNGGVYSFPYALKDQFTFGTLDFSEFKMVLEFIKSRSDTNIISNPRVATLNNIEANIMVGQTLNLPTYERNSSTGKMEITGYEAKDLGIKMKVTPHINANDEIVVELAPEISDLVRYDTLDQASGVVAPVFSQRTAKTQVRVKNGETIFIGGLIKENDVKTKRKIPFIGDLLGDVPFIGYLFSKQETSKQKTELVFFITVNLMVPGEDIKNIPQSNQAYVPVYEFIPTKEKKGSKRSFR